MLLDEVTENPLLKQEMQHLHGHAQQHYSVDPVEALGLDSSSIHNLQETVESLSSPFTTFNYKFTRKINMIMNSYNFLSCSSCVKARQDSPCISLPFIQRLSIIKLL
jgi:hypothetical protein